MSWWKKRVLLSIVWLGLSIGAAILHTDFVLAGRITPEQDATISYRYGVACGLGLLAIWAIFLYRARAALTASPASAKSIRLLRFVIVITVAAFGLYSFVGQDRGTRVRAIVQSINAASANPLKLPPGRERYQDLLRRLKAIDTRGAPPEAKQALDDYIAILQRSADDMAAGRDLSLDIKASVEWKDRMIAIERKYE